MPAFQCPNCELVFAAQGELDWHVREDHRARPAPPPEPSQPEPSQPEPDRADAGGQAASAGGHPAEPRRPRWWRRWRGSPRR
jgi:hypothetical protein